MQQAQDFRDEAEAVFALLEPMSDADLDRVTQFKGWTINHILQHLYFFDRLAGYSVADPEKFDRSWAELQALRDTGAELREATQTALDDFSGTQLRTAWHEGTRALAQTFATADPKQRVKWAGPSMSARSSITARLMETWSHAQAIYDLAGIQRTNQDGIRNIVVLGVNTFGWSFSNRDETVPDTVPFLRLTAPSGAIWEWGEATNPDQIEGLAEDFCMVVTQTRNVADTGLHTRGPIAHRWMEIAQCFAGVARMPPSPGERFSKTS